MYSPCSSLHEWLPPELSKEVLCLHACLCAPSSPLHPWVSPPPQAHTANLGVSSSLSSSRQFSLRHPRSEIPPRFLSPPCSGCFFKFQQSGPHAVGNLIAWIIVTPIPEGEEYYIGPGVRVGAALLAKDGLSIGLQPQPPTGPWPTYSLPPTLLSGNSICHHGASGCQVGMYAQGQ